MKQSLQNTSSGLSIRINSKEDKIALDEVEKIDWKMDWQFAIVFNAINTFPMLDLCVLWWVCICTTIYKWLNFSKLYQSVLIQPPSLTVYYNWADCLLAWLHADDSLATMLFSRYGLLSAIILRACSNNVLSTWIYRSVCASIKVIVEIHHY